MITYSVVLSPQALADIEGIFTYIAVSLQSPTDAARQVAHIEEKIQSLDTLPKRCRVFSLDVYPGFEARRLLVDNYSIYYYIDGSEVIIANVTYSPSILENHIR